MGIGGSIGTLGLATALSYAAARTGTVSKLFGWHRYRIVSVPVAGMPIMPRGHTVRWLEAGELARHAIDVDARVQMVRFAAGLSCIAAFAGEELVGVNWLGTEHYEEDEVRVRYVLPANSAWDTGLWVVPERRLGRAFAAVWAGTAEWLREHGLTRTMSRIADYNTASLQSHWRMDAVEVAKLAVLSIGDIQVGLGARPVFTRTAIPVVDLQAQ